VIMNTRTTKIVVFAAAILTSGAAWAHSDLTVDVVPPSTADVYEMARYDVYVDNVGNKTADGVTLTIELPETATSPNVFVMGELGAMSGSCAQVGTELECDLGRIRRGQSASVYFEIALPQNDGPLTISATADTRSRENSTSNNSDTIVADLDNFNMSLNGTYGVTNRHCTGSGLTSFFECVVSPGSVSTHDIQLNSNGSITFPYPLDSIYTGAWSQSASDHLTFYYETNGYVVMVFNGYGVGNDCFEGVTVFPYNTNFVAPYQACLRYVGP
ncbi:MAG: hypothetical protein KC561_20205, partial [Myxococcales bacterium]|nr:hypothetical protein [Myxococcales bacterium]